MLKHLKSWFSAILLASALRAEAINLRSVTIEDKEVRGPISSCVDSKGLEHIIYATSNQLWYVRGDDLKIKYPVSGANYVDFSEPFVTTDLEDNILYVFSGKIRYANGSEKWYHAFGRIADGVWSGRSIDSPNGSVSSEMVIDGKLAHVVSDYKTTSTNNPSDINLYSFDKEDMSAPKTVKRFGGAGQQLNPKLKKESEFKILWEERKMDTVFSGTLDSTNTLIYGVISPKDLSIKLFPLTNSPGAFNADLDLMKDGTPIIAYKNAQQKAETFNSEIYIANIDTNSLNPLKNVFCITNAVTQDRPLSLKVDNDAINLSWAEQVGTETVIKYWNSGTVTNTSPTNIVVNPKVKTLDSITSQDGWVSMDTLDGLPLINVNAAGLRHYEFVRPVLTSLGLQNQQLHMTISNVSEGVNYELEATEDLISSNWQPVAGFTYSNDYVNFYFPFSPTNMFLRLKEKEE